MKKRIIFVCTHNSARSQIAEGYTNARYGDRYDAFSAGSKPGSLNPYAVRAMAEVGIDISGHHAKGLDEFEGIEMDVLVSVCEGGICPFFPWAKKEIHRGFPDPSKLNGTDEEIMTGIRLIRNEIVSWIDNNFGEI